MLRGPRMAPSVSDSRATAARVAKWLVDKSKPDEAVAILSAWAAGGPNDAEGQQLLAEALRIDPGARIAQMAARIRELRPTWPDDSDPTVEGPEE